MMVGEEDTSKCLQLHESLRVRVTHSLTCVRAAVGSGGGGGGARGGGGGGGGGGGVGMLKPETPAETNTVTILLMHCSH